MDKYSWSLLVGVIILLFHKQIINIFSKIVNGTLQSSDISPNTGDNVYNALKSESGKVLMQSDSFKDFAKTPHFDILIKDLNESQIDNLCKI